MFHKFRWQRLSNASCHDGQDIVFEVTHPFLPLYKQKFKLIAYYHHWESHRVSFYNNEKRFVSLPTSWTSLFPRDLFVEQSAGRSLFRVADLLELNNFIETCSQEINQIETNKLKDIDVKEITS
ncbi:MAG: hypothetical protein HOD92_25895 [Deltaproteobacteria bacterium]|nr:hypothetical protein [Deltaproteobacteria bacterium]